MLFFLLCDFFGFVWVLSSLRSSNEEEIALLHTTGWAEVACIHTKHASSIHIFHSINTGILQGVEKPWQPYFIQNGTFTLFLHGDTLQSHCVYVKKKKEHENTVCT